MPVYSLSCPKCGGLISMSLGFTASYETLADKFRCARCGQAITLSRDQIRKKQAQLAMRSKLLPILAGSVVICEAVSIYFSLADAWWQPIVVAVMISGLVLGVWEELIYRGLSRQDKTRSAPTDTPPGTRL